MLMAAKHSYSDRTENDSNAAKATQMSDTQSEAA